LEQGFILGKPLRFSFFREIKLRGKRVYFPTYNDFEITMFVSASTKKMQKEEIDNIKSQFREFYQIAKNIYDSNK